MLIIPSLKFQPYPNFLTRWINLLKSLIIVKWGHFMQITFGDDDIKVSEDVLYMKK